MKTVNIISLIYFNSLGDEYEFATSILSEEPSRNQLLLWALDSLFDLGYKPIDLESPSEIILEKLDGGVNSKYFSFTFQVIRSGDPEYDEPDSMIEDFKVRIKKSEINNVLPLEFYLTYDDKMLRKLAKGFLEEGQNEKV